MGPIRFLTASHILRMHYTHLFPLPLDAKTRQPATSQGVANPLLQPSYLESALASPLNHHYYGGTTNIFPLAALVAEKLALNHPFYDGNKRTALFSMDMFLRLNGESGVVVRQSTPGCWSKMHEDTAPSPESTASRATQGKGIAHTSRGITELSPTENAIANAMVDVATGRMHSDELSSLVIKTTRVS